MDLKQTFSPFHFVMQKWTNILLDIILTNENYMWYYFITYIKTNFTLGISCTLVYRFKKNYFLLIIKWPYFCKKADQGLRVKSSCTKIIICTAICNNQHLSYIMWISQVVEPIKYERDIVCN